MDDRCYERGERVQAFVADCEAAAKRLPKNAVAAIRDAGVRIVVHEETGKWTHMCYHPRQGQSWLRDQGFDENLAGCVQLYRLDDYAGDRGLWGQGGSIVHELSHAYHDCYLRDGHGNKFIGRRYDRAVHAERLYDAVRVKGPRRSRATRPSGACCSCARRRAAAWAASTASRGATTQRRTRPSSSRSSRRPTLCRDDEDYNKWEPHNQRQLWKFDPETCKLLERVWDDGEALDDDCADEPPPPPPRSLLCCRVLRWGGRPCLGGAESAGAVARVT